MGAWGRGDAAAGTVEIGMWLDVLGEPVSTPEFLNGGWTTTRKMKKKIAAQNAFKNTYKHIRIIKKCQQSL